MKVISIEIFWKPLIAVVVSAAISLLVCQVFLDAEQRVGLFVGCGYYAVAVSLLLAVVFGLWPFLKSVKGLAFDKWDYSALGILLLVYGVLFSLEPNRFKVVFDETLLLGTSKMMSEYNQPVRPVEGYWYNGEFVYADFDVDKRPILYPMVVSLVHSVKGYSDKNPMLVNNVVSLALILLMYLFARRYSGVFPSFTACLLFLTIPEFVMIGNGGGLGPLNLLVILMVVYMSGIYLSEPSRKSLNGLVFSGVLLSQVRSESIVLIGAVVVIVVLGAYRRKRLDLSSWSVFAPPLVALYLLQYAVFELKPSYWQDLSAESEGVMGVGYVLKNIGLNVRYFFNIGIESSNSLSLSVLGTGSLLFLCFMVVRRRVDVRSNPYLQAFLVFLGILCLEVLLFQFYYAGSFIKVTRSRHTLPFLLFVSLLIPFILEVFLPRKAWVCAFILCLLSFEWGIINFPELLHQTRFDYAENENWKNGFAKAHASEKFLVLADQYPLIWILNEQSGVPVSATRRYIEALNFLQKLGYYDAIYYYDLEHRELTETIVSERNNLRQLLELEAIDDGVFQGKQAIYKVVNIKLPPPDDMPLLSVHWSAVGGLEDEVLKTRIMLSFPLWD